MRLESILKKGLKLKYAGFLMRFFAMRWGSPGEIKTSSLTVSLERTAGIWADSQSSVALGDWIYLKSGTMVEAHDGASVRLGSNFFANRNCTIVARAGIEIGPECMLGEGVSIYDHNYRHCLGQGTFREQGYVARKIKIGANVWIGSKAFIGSGVTIGDNVVIGANSIVVKDIPSGSVAHSESRLMIRPLSPSAGDESRHS